MCGIAGVIGMRGPALAEGPARAMLDAIAHRGPDDEGQWREGGAWLGHRRLSIIDTSQAGRQPMVSACGRYVMVTNGEIYNYRQMRTELEAVGAGPWRGHSDTEVLLEAVARFGIEGALERATGMFALAVWDRRERVAWLTRDRFGEKPLYYATKGGVLSFASELGALERAPHLALELSKEALSLFFRLGYVPAPHSIYEGVWKVPPACLVTWRDGESGVSVRPYWSLGEVAQRGEADPLINSEAAVEALDGLLREVVADQMISDVPLGVFLSGGVDSSLVTAIMQAVSARPVKTFTLGFDSAEFNEAEYASAVARHLKTNHTEHIVTAADAQAILPRLGHLHDEPFADASQAPTFMVSQMARQQVSVCLTGDGGDEMFGGYVRYPGAPRLWRAIRALPMRRTLAELIEALPMKGVEGALRFLAPLAREYASRGRLGPSVRRAAAFLPAASFDELYELTMTAWPDPETLLKSPGPPPLPWRPARPALKDDFARMQWRDSVDYLPGDILAKVDRASMAHGLETRAPLLDRRIAAFAWRAPTRMKLREGRTKWLLRSVLHRYVPPDLVDRPKLGFSVPLHAWLTGALRGWAESLIGTAAIARQGVLEPAPVAAVWRRYLAGDSSVDHRVWTLLMFQSWMAARST
ncbi:MAG TPA: asparagine synthase (glutamine-hydrolyzing) [Caulobacteraceae bacterium]